VLVDGGMFDVPYAKHIGLWSNPDQPAARHRFG
jgi:hypothetical protein